MRIYSTGKIIIGIFALTIMAGSAFAASAQVDLHRVTKNGQAEKVGTVNIEEPAYGRCLLPISMA